jgi:hypothetical protein
MQRKAVKVKDSQFVGYSILFSFLRFKAKGIKR